ncbi:hypothetical protein FA15DRAFT_582790 [Coprinopsis marcescibilis]|uniref:ER membrane protein complex subunit 10 n=1 Tax=Coprinopsis marcescibilis TaxID=230819 RepID=A0A5C3L981_COPMA|nr:hypothetical protein FA15DRAFT_582790 [Coprinopsis marcescibilis]
MKAISLLLAFLTTAYGADYKLHHRVFHPQLPVSQWTEHAIVSLGGDGPQFQAQPRISQDFQSFSDSLKSATNDLNEALYQVALQPSADAADNEWSVSSVKLCHLLGTTSQTVVLYLTSEEAPYSLNYFLSPTPHGGSCPPLIMDMAKPLSHVQLNTTLSLRMPSSPPLPELRAPPSLTPEGKIATPVPEKSFIQKYWIYIAIGFAVLSMCMEPRSLSVSANCLRSADGQLRAYRRGPGTSKVMCIISPDPGLLRAGTQCLSLLDRP